VFLERDPCVSSSLADVQKHLLECFVKHEDPVAKADRAKTERAPKLVKERRSHLDFHF